MPPVESLSLESLVLGPRFDSGAALACINGDAALYARLLSRLRLRLAEFRTALQADLDESNWSGLTESSHSLKGVAFTLGASAVGEATSTLESAIGKMQEGSGERQTVSSAFSDLLRMMALTDQDLEGAGVVCQVAGPPEIAQDLLKSVDEEKLRKALRLGDFVALMQLVSHLPDEHRLRCAIKNFDLASVKKMLE